MPGWSGPQGCRSAAGGLLALGLALGIALLPTTATDSAALQLPGDPATANLLAAEQAMLDLTNTDRSANGVLALDFDPDTLAVARQRASSQLGTPALSHYDDRGRLAFASLLADANVPYELAGENLARSSTDDPGVPQRIEQALMQSPAHRKNILEQSFTRVAIGEAADGHGQVTFAEVYRN